MRPNFAIFEAITDPIFVYDAHGQIVFRNRAAETAYGWTANQVLCRRTELSIEWATVVADDISSNELHRERYWRGEVSRRLKDGRNILVDCQLITLVAEDGSLELTMDLSRDTSHFHLQENQLRDTSRILQAVMDNTSSYIHVRDAQGRFIYVNDEYEKVFNVPHGTTIGKLIEEVFEADVAAVRREMHETVMRNPHELHAEIVQEVDGAAKTFMDVKSPLLDENGNVYAIYCIGTDITERKALESNMVRLAHYDTITGLPNRVLFQDRLQEALKKSRRTGHSMALLFLDLDRFKEVNDTLGHETGDLLIKAVGLRLQAQVRASDTVARMGGDEFTVILENARGPLDIEPIACKIHNALLQSFDLQGKDVFVTTSIGITISPQDGSDAGALLRNADHAMYASKQAGPGGYRFYTESMNSAAAARFRITTDLKRALRQNQFRLVYQPIVSLRDGSVKKAEALIRWEHPEHGLINPADFIPIAENTGDIVEVGNWVFREAVRQCAVWRQELHPQFQISVNTSPIQYRNGGLDLAGWAKCLSDLGLTGDSIVVEITEGLMMDATLAIKDQLRACSEAGMEIALDDFGTGYSSLSYLKKFEVDYLKIDRAFVTNLALQSDDLVLCEAIVAMAHKLGLQVIAEGIETQVQRDLLTAAGCDYGQGYLFSKPMAALAFELYLAQR